MKTLHSAVIIYALLSPWTAQAADLLPAPPPESPQYGSCALTAQQVQDAKTGKKPGQPPAAPRKPRNKTDINLISDPCNMVDAERQVDEVRNDGMSSTQRLALYDDVMEWNRRRTGTDQPELWWLTAPPSGPRYGDGNGMGAIGGFASPTALPPPFGHAERNLLLEQGQALPAVPEPAAYGLWLAGLALLAAAARRRAQRR